MRESEQSLSTAEECLLQGAALRDRLATQANDSEHKVTVALVFLSLRHLATPVPLIAAQRGVQPDSEYLISAGERFGRGESADRAAPLERSRDPRG